MREGAGEKGFAAFSCRICCHSISLCTIAKMDCVEASMTSVILRNRTRLLL